jgi:hypothetical protein
MSSLAPYRVWLRSRSALVLSKPVTLTFRDSKTVVTNNRLPGNHEAEPFGLVYVVDVLAETIENALVVARNLAAHVANQLSITHAAAIEDPAAMIAFDMDPAVPDREMAQLERGFNLADGPRRHFRPDVFREWFNRWTVANDDAKVSLRLGRALTYLRRSILEKDPIDQFEDLWNGLETINVLMQRKYNLPTTFKSTCPHCGQERDIPGNSSGMRYTVETLRGESAGTWDKIATFRNGIVHGFADFPEVFDNITSHLAVVRAALVVGCLDIVGFPKERWETILREPLVLVEGAEALLRSRLKDLSVDAFVSMREVPHYELVLEQLRRTGEPLAMGRKTVALAANLRLIGFDGEGDPVDVSLKVQVDPEDSRGTLVRTENRQEPPRSEESRRP